MEQILKVLFSLIKPSVVLLVLIFLLILNTLIFKKSKYLPTNGGVAKGAISIFIVLFGIVAFLLVLPIDKALKGQVLGFLGIIISAGIALSSTTLLGNLIAGIMNNSMKRFRNGDLIQIGEYQGRVIRKNILHTEIQLQDSNFITLPNLYIANNPVKLIRKANSVISTSVSLGYDVSRIKIEESLQQAAIAAGLSEPYVYITSLGDFSVVYKIHGFLEDSDTYFSSSSLLNAKVMDKLHEAKIEIVSPSFMNQRRVDQQEFIPRTVTDPSESNETKTPEDLVFDEAIKSEKIEIKKDFLVAIVRKHGDLKETLKNLKGSDEAEKIKSAIKRTEELRDQIENNIREQVEKDKQK